MKIKSQRQSNRPHYVFTRSKKRTDWFRVSVFVFYSFATLLVVLLSAGSTRGELDATSRAVDQMMKMPLPPIMLDLPGADPVKALKDDYNKPSSLWVVVNKERSIPTNYAPDNLVLPDVLTRTDKTTDEQKTRRDVAQPLQNMFDDAKKAGYELMLASGYRPADLQQYYFDSYVRDSGLAVAQMYSAVPGHSEHQTGLAVDISTYGNECYLESCPLGADAGQWLHDNAFKYGFILRYPEGKEHITGYNFEPWHYRYVGSNLAEAINSSGLTLDEAWPYLEKAWAKLKNR